MQPNYNTVVNRATPMNLANSDYHYRPDTTRLYLFSPRQLPTQVLRSHRYNFSPQFVDSMVHGRKSYDIVQNFTNSQSGPAILPDTTGMIMDTSIINQQWSFVLIIDRSANVGYNNLKGVGGTRQILLGYVSSYDEPYNRATGTVNPNAVLNFTNTTTVRLVQSFGNNAHAKTYISNMYDYANELTAQQYQDSTYLMSPRDMLNPHVMYHGNNNIDDMFDVSNMVLDNVRVRTDKDGKEQIDGSLSVDATLKSPVCHVSTLAENITLAVDSLNASNAFKSSMNQQNGLESEANNAKMILKANMPGNKQLVSASGLDASYPITIGGLDNLTGNTLVVQPFELPAYSQWDVAPQEGTTTKNVMSSFTTMALSSIVVNCGLAHIVFRYASWVRGNMASPSSGWEILNCSTLMDMPDPTAQLHRLEDFKSLCEAQVFPILKQVSGDFDLMAYVNAGGEILVDLNFLDFNASNNNVGFYETNTRLGGMLNPMIANNEVLSNNASSLNYLADEIITQSTNTAAAMS